MSGEGKRAAQRPTAPLLNFTDQGSQAAHPGRHTGTEIGSTIPRNASDHSRAWSRASLTSSVSRADQRPVDHLRLGRGERLAGAETHGERREGEVARLEHVGLAFQARSDPTQAPPSTATRRPRPVATPARCAPRRARAAARPPPSCSDSAFPFAACFFSESIRTPMSSVLHSSFEHSINASPSSRRVTVTKCLQTGHTAWKSLPPLISVVSRSGTAAKSAHTVSKVVMTAPPTESATVLVLALGRCRRSRRYGRWCEQPGRVAVLLPAGEHRSAARAHRRTAVP